MIEPFSISYFLSVLLLSVPVHYFAGLKRTAMLINEKCSGQKHDLFRNQIKIGAIIIFLVLTGPIVILISLSTKNFDALMTIFNMMCIILGVCVFHPFMTRFYMFKPMSKHYIRRLLNKTTKRHQRASDAGDETQVAETLKMIEWIKTELQVPETS